MAWYQFWKSKRRSKQDGEQKQKKQRDGNHLNRYLDYLYDEDRTKWVRIMEKQAGIDTSLPMDLDTFAATHQRLKDLGMIPSGEGKDSVDKVVDALPKLLDRLGPDLPMLIAAARGSPITIVQQGQASPPALPEPKPQAQEQVERPAQPKRQKRNTEVTAVPIPIQAQVKAAIMILDTLPPPNAAGWLLAQARQHPELNKLLDIVRATPDDRLLQVMDEQIKEDSDFAEFGAFLRRKGQWTFDVARAIRRAAIQSMPGGKKKVSTL